VPYEITNFIFLVVLFQEKPSKKHGLSLHGSISKSVTALLKLDVQALTELMWNLLLQN
jgi:hypothetical protein